MNLMEVWFFNRFCVLQPSSAPPNFDYWIFVIGDGGGEDGGGGDGGGGDGGGGGGGGGGGVVVV